MKQLNIGLMFMRVFQVSNYKMRSFMCEFLEEISKYHVEFKEILQRSKNEIDLIPEILQLMPSENLKEFLSFLERIIENEELRITLRGKDEILLNLSFHLLKSKDELCVRYILQIIKRFLMNW